MAYKQSQQTPKPTTRDERNDCGCVELESPTQKKTINVFRQDYCKELYSLWGEVVKLQERRNKLKTLIRDKTCWFVWTEKNYSIHRNLTVTISSELLQTGDSIKEGVKTYSTSNKNLAESLKKITKTLMEVKTKTEDLREAAFRLNNCLKDPCNCSQLVELGIPEEGCKGAAVERKEPQSPPCPPEQIKEFFRKLICMPENLVKDVTSVLNSAANTQGIQRFTNTNSLDTFNTELVERIKKFDKQVSENVKRSETDLKTSLEDLIKSKKDQAKTLVELYSKRNDFEGVKDAVKLYCCAPCPCIVDEDDCAPRLQNCEEDICDICSRIKDEGDHADEDDANLPVPTTQRTTAR